ncbi:LysM domain-containing protein [Phlyctema vagabunda]|uniref:LysM domain-containing protein n=1 Tax=Phlyctema vagabunda TaxID=108571 RepID=A0ABR4PKG8_9HELO
MAPHEDEMIDDEPPVIEPYTILGVTKTATEGEIKAAYRKAALKHHPDKAPEHLKDAAHTQFQEVAFAYAVLSDPQRRKCYDATGSTSESIVDSEGFSWSDFYSEQFRDIISGDAIEKFAKEYKGSDEEKDDILNAYEKCEGSWEGIFEVVMLSTPKNDEPRFRAIIDAAIESGDVEAYDAYTKETRKSKAKRLAKANEEEEEAMELAKELGVADKLFAKGKKGKKEGGDDALAALILQRQAGRGSFLDNLEAKYGQPKSKAKKGKKRASEDEEDGGMPTEEDFQKAAEKLKKKKSSGDTADGRKSKRTKR